MSAQSAGNMSRHVRREAGMGEGQCEEQVSTCRCCSHWNCIFSGVNYYIICADGWGSIRWVGISCGNFHFPTKSLQERGEHYLLFLPRWKSFFFFFSPNLLTHGVTGLKKIRPFRQNVQDLRNQQQLYYYSASFSSRVCFSSSDKLSKNFQFLSRLPETPIISDN